MKASDPNIVTEQIFNTHIHKVWRAITELEEMKQWYFSNIPDFKAQLGFQTSFTIENEGRIFPHHWKIIEVIDNQKIVYNWFYENYEGDSNITFELFEIESQCTKLVVTCEITKDFTAGIPEFTRESAVGGWHYFIKESLVQYLTKKS